MPNLLCENSKDVSQGLEVKLLCNILNQPCICWRYCTTRKSPVMLDSYNTCPFRAKAGDEENMGRPKKIVNEETILSPTVEETPAPKPKKEKSKTQKIICNVIYKNPKKYAIDFLGGGIMFRDSNPDKTDKVEIIYDPESFEIISKKFI